jgi:predicted protein tyrosine phosphatase
MYSEGMTKNVLVIPVIRNLREAQQLASDFPAVITAGPNRTEVQFGHGNHHVQAFRDSVWGTNSPTHKAMENILKFSARNTGEILIHCHAGMSRSTSTAIGVLIQRGLDPYDAFEMLKDRHPKGRPFIPNAKIMGILGDIFGYTDLAEYSVTNEYDPSGSYIY